MPDPNALPGFGQVDLDLDESAEDSPPESTARAGKVTRRRSEDEPIPAEAARNEPATRTAKSDSVSAYTRSRPSAGKSIGEQPTRMGSFDQLVAASRNDPSASESGIATRDDRVAAMREAYARGDADVALELAQVVGADHPDASIAVQVAGEVEVDFDVPVHDGTVELEIISEEPSEGVDIVRSALTLTERQSIPRVVLGPGELAKLPIDPRGGFLLSQVDGMQTLEEILDVCAMPAEEALGVFDQLKALGVIEFE
jgi:hypothetical protein